jgi:hypothetical protein
MLYLTGVNEYRVLRVVEDERWKAWGSSHQFDWPRESLTEYP